jgi:pyruvate dehydrogenase E2 component (dihydrolipoamide acetyltransferase)
MAIEITIPRLGWNMEEGTFVGWLKQDGDKVQAGEALFSLEGEKATEEIECLDSGVLRVGPNGPRPGDKLAVGTVIGFLVQPGEAMPAAEPAPAQTARPAAAASPSARRLARKMGVEVSRPLSDAAAGQAAKPNSSPRARRLARQLGIDWQQVKGSGRTGRIRERDIQAAVGQSQGNQTQSLRPSGIRQTIASHLLASARATAAVTLTTTADAVNLVNFRQQFKDAGSPVVPSFTDLLVKLAAAALEQHPMLNASWVGDQITVHSEVHIGVAVDTDHGLLVPVVRNVPQRSVRQVAEHLSELIDRARLGKLKVQDMEGGTFTLTNLGAFGIETFTPIIHYPQCAVLGIGRIQRRPVAHGSDLVAREQLPLSLTFDHRLVDGAPAARFLQTLVRLIENPAPSLVS